LHALHARKWIAKLRERAPDIHIEIRWCPAHSEVAGNEKADEWAKQAAAEPDRQGTEWLGYSDRYGRRGMLLPRPIANIRREEAEKKWVEARTWCERRVNRKKYGMPRSQRPNRLVDRGSKRIARRFHQLRSGHCRTGQYLKWTKNADTATCGWCQYKNQTREHLLKHCPRWKTQQKILWAEVRKETGKGKSRFTVRDLFADERFTRSILDFLRTTRVGARVGPKGLPPGSEEAEELRERAAETE